MPARALDLQSKALTRDFRDLQVEKSASIHLHYHLPQLAIDSRKHQGLRLGHGLLYLERLRPLHTRLISLLLPSPYSPLRRLPLQYLRRSRRRQPRLGCLAH